MCFFCTFCPCEPVEEVLD